MNDDYIDKRKHTIILFIFVSSIACVALILTVIGFTVFAPSQNRGVGHGKNNTYGNYAGPLLLMITDGVVTYLSADRMIIYSFNESSSKSYSDIYTSDLHITDKYIIYNTDSKSKPVKLIYPFICSISDFPNYKPTLSVDGSAVQCKVLVGNYMGGFDSDKLNLKLANSWMDYSVMNDKEILTSMMSSANDIDEVVTVYTFSDLLNINDPDSSARLSFEFHFNAEKTTILANGMEGMTSDTNTGYRRYTTSFSSMPGNCLLISVGEPLIDYELKGFDDYSCQTELADFSGTVNVNTAKLSDIIMSVVEKDRKSVV